MSYFNHPWKPDRSRNYFIALAMSLGLVLVVFNLGTTRMDYADGGSKTVALDEEIPVVRTLQKEEKKVIVPPPERIERVSLEDFVSPELVTYEDRQVSDIADTAAVADTICLGKESGMPAAPAPDPSWAEDLSEPVTFAQHWPYYGDCRDLEGSAEEKKACSIRSIREFLVSELRYPNEAMERHEEGRAVIELVIGLDGRIEKASLVRDPGFGMGAEALRAVRKMDHFSAASNSGRRVRFKMFIPVEFALER